MNSIFDKIGNVPQATQQAPNLMDMFNNPQATQGIQQISQMFNQVGNMQGGFDQLIPMLEQQNPQMAETLKMIQGGGNPQELFQKQCEAMGIPQAQQQQFMQELRKRIG